MIQSPSETRGQTMVNSGTFTDSQVAQNVDGDMVIGGKFGDVEKLYYGVSRKK